MRKTLVVAVGIFFCWLRLGEAGEVIPLAPGAFQHVKITGTDGDLTVEATGKNPHFWTGAIPETAKLETHPILAFEYFAAEGLPEFKLRIPKTEGGETIASPIGLSESWRSHAIDLRASSSAYVAGKQKNFAFILTTPVGHRFQIRNIHLREANALENKSMSALEETRQAREIQARAIEGYLATKFPVPPPRVIVGESSITIKARVEKGIVGTIALAEVQNDQPTYSAVSPAMHLEASQQWTGPDISLTLPRMVGLRDRATSCWKLVSIDERGRRTTLTPATYATEVSTPRKLPQLTSKGIKGLGGAHGGDPKHEIFELGLQHATVNIVLNAVLTDHAIPGGTPINYEGKPFFVNEAHLRGLDASIRGFTDRGILVSAILLVGNARHPDGNPHSKMVHPEALPAGNFAMPDLQTPHGTRLYKAVIDLLTERYTRETSEHGRIVNWILHNEIDQSGVWTTMGEQPLHRYIETFMRSARLVYHSAQRFDRQSRVFVSLTHHWTKQSGGPQTFVVRDILDLFAKFARHEGDFNWGVAYHPYPQPMFHPDVWNNKVDFHFDTAYITPKNIEVLVNYLKQPAFQYQGRTRGILLSEQGVNALSLSESDQKMQAAGIVYTMRKVRQYPEIEAYHYHAYRDSPEAEGGLLLGLTNREYGRKMAWHVYAAIDTPNEAEVSKFADEFFATSLLH